MAKATWGKTFFAANLVAALAKQGHRVHVIDFDLGLTKLDVVLNQNPDYPLHGVQTGKALSTEAVSDIRKFGRSVDSYRGHPHCPLCAPGCQAALIADENHAWQPGRAGYSAN